MMLNTATGICLDHELKTVYLVPFPSSLKRHHCKFSFPTGAVVSFLCITVVLTSKMDSNWGSSFIVTVVHYCVSYYIAVL